MNLQDAKKKIMDYVARRDHSEKELRKKLATRCEPDVINAAITWAQEQNWLAAPEVLTERMAGQLHRRGHGIRRINQKLKEKGLHSVSGNSDDELEKAKRLVLNKWSSENFRGLDFKESQKLKAKIMRFLMTRGYESHIINQILKTEFKIGAPAYDEEF